MGPHDGDYILNEKPAVAMAGPLNIQWVAAIAIVDINNCFYTSKNSKPTYP